jgi:hypothetical protein
MMRTETAWVDSWLGEEMGGDNHLPSHPSLTTAQLNNREGWSSSIAPSHLSPLPSPSGVSKLHLANPPTVPLSTHRMPNAATYLSPTPSCPLTPSDPLSPSTASRHAPKAYVGD